MVLFIQLSSAWDRQVRKICFIRRAGLGFVIFCIAGAAGIAGYYISRAKFSKSGKKERNLLFSAILYVSLVHGLSNFFTILECRILYLCVDCSLAAVDLLSNNPYK